MTSGALLRLVVTVAEGAALDEVATALRGLGFEVDEVLPAVGAITGRAPESAVRAIRRTRGVETVVPDGATKIAPPGSDIQ